MGVSWQDAQTAVLGSLLLSPEETAPEIFQQAKREHFGDPECRHIFDAARELWEENTPLDPVTVCARAGDQYKQKIADMMRMTPTAQNFRSYLEILRSRARLAALQGEAMKMIDGDATEEQAIEAYERMGQLLQGTDRAECMTLEQLIGEFFDRMNDQTPPDYLDWGMEKLNRELYISPGTFVLLGGDSSSGKTALGLQFAFHMAQTGKKIGFISIETTKDRLTDRLMAETQVAGIALPDIKRRKLQEDDYRRGMNAAMKEGSRNLSILTKCHSLAEIRAQILIHRFDAVFIDYVQLIEEAGKDRFQIVANISIGLHRMAQQLGVTIIGLCQITKDRGSSDALTKENVRESQQLKQDAEVILMLAESKDEEDPPNTRVLSIVKNKDGRCVRMKLRFKPQYMTFSELVTLDGMRAERKAAKQMADVKAKKKKAAQVSFETLPEGEEGDLPF